MRGGGRRGGLGPMTVRPLNLLSDVHRRFNPLSGEWVLVSPHRTARPWQGQVERRTPASGAAYDSTCYLCPGNARAGGITNPNYDSTFVFDNDFASLLPPADTTPLQIGGLLEARGESGRCRVVCYSPLHNASLGQLALTDIRTVIDTWAVEYQDLGADPQISAVTIFENRGAMMGASNPHPHGQIWANETVPDKLGAECRGQRRYYDERGTCLLCDYAALEARLGARIVRMNAHFIAVVPFWAVWPFETLVLPRAHVGAVGGLDPAARDGFAQILKALTIGYDTLFDIAFPYTMGLHQQPTDGVEHPHWHAHAHFYPPLLRSATVRKFMVGYEMLAGPQRDITPEAAAERLRGAAHR